MGVKYGDIGKKSKDAFDGKYWVGGIKVQDKAESGDDVLSILPRYQQGVGLKFVYKHTLEQLSGVRMEAQAEVTQKSGVDAELLLSKGALSTTFKNDSNDTTAEVAIKETVAGAKVALSAKAAGLAAQPKFSFSANAGYELSTDVLTLQAGGKVGLAGGNVKPEAQIALLTSFGELFAQWNGADSGSKTFHHALLVPGPKLFGFDLSLGAQAHLTKQLALNSAAVALQARQSKDLMYCLKLDDVHKPAPTPSVSVVLSHKPIADSKESVSITATWKLGKNELGLSASRA